MSIWLKLSKHPASSFSSSYMLPLPRRLKVLLLSIWCSGLGWWLERAAWRLRSQRSYIRWCGWWSMFFFRRDRHKASQPVHWSSKENQKQAPNGFQPTLIVVFVLAICTTFVLFLIDIYQELSLMCMLSTCFTTKMHWYFDVAGSCLRSFVCTFLYNNLN